MDARDSARSFLLGVLLGSLGGLLLGSILTALSVDRLAAASEAIVRRLMRRPRDVRFDLMVQ